MKKETCRLGPFCLRGPALAFVGRHWLLWDFVGLCWPSVAVVGCYGPLLSIKWKKKIEKNTPRAQTTRLASFGPFLSSLTCVGLCWPLLAAVGFSGPVLAFGGHHWSSLAVVGLCWPSLAAGGAAGGEVVVVVMVGGWWW